MLAAFFLGLAMFFALDAVAGAPAEFWAAGTCVLVGYVLVQTGFHNQISWSLAGVVFRGAFITRAVPWAAVSEFGVGGGSVLARGAGQSIFPVGSADIQVLLADPSRRRPSPATRTADTLNEILANLPAATPTSSAPQIVSALSRPGRLAVSWLGVQVLILVALVATA